MLRDTEQRKARDEVRAMEALIKEGEEELEGMEEGTAGRVELAKVLSGHRIELGRLKKVSEIHRTCI